MRMTAVVKSPSGTVSKNVNANGVTVAAVFSFRKQPTITAVVPGVTVSSKPSIVERADIVGDIAKQGKPFELGRLEFGFLVVVWAEWKQRHPERLQAPRVKALDERISKHFEDAYR